MEYDEVRCHTSGMGPYCGWGRPTNGGSQYVYLGAKLLNYNSNNLQVWPQQHEGLVSYTH